MSLLNETPGVMHDGAQDKAEGARLSPPAAAPDPAKKARPAGRGIALIPACRYAQAGLVALGAACGVPIDVLEVTDDLDDATVSAYQRVLCDLSGGLETCLGRVALLGHILTLGVPVVLITQGPPPPWLYDTLCHFTGHGGTLPALCVIEGRRPLADMAALLKETPPSACLALRDAVPVPTSGLTRQEVAVLLAVLNGESVRAMTARTGLKVSTLHAHRHSGLRKLGMLRGPGRRRRRA